MPRNSAKLQPAASLVHTNHNDMYSSLNLVKSLSALLIALENFKLYIMYKLGFQKTLKSQRQTKISTPLEGFVYMSFPWFKQRLKQKASKMMKGLEHLSYGERLRHGTVLPGEEKA